MHMALHGVLNTSSVPSIGNELKRIQLSELFRPLRHPKQPRTCTWCVEHKALLPYIRVGPSSGKPICVITCIAKPLVFHTRIDNQLIDSLLPWRRVRQVPSFWMPQSLLCSQYSHIPGHNRQSCKAAKPRS